MQVKPWRMFRANAGENGALVQGTLTLCRKTLDEGESVTRPFGSIRAIWVSDRGERVTFDTSHVEHLDEEGLPRELTISDTQGFQRSFEVYGEIPVTGEQIRMTVVSVAANPKVG